MKVRRAEKAAAEKAETRFTSCGGVIVNGGKRMSFVTKIVQGAINLFQKNSLAQEEAARKAADKTVTEGMPALLRRAAAEGAVLLKNQNSALPDTRRI